MISDIITACGGYFTPAASKVTPSYPSVFQWPRQQHNITSVHKSIVPSNSSCQHLQSPLKINPTTRSLDKNTNGKVVYVNEHWADNRSFVFSKSAAAMVVGPLSPTGRAFNELMVQQIRDGWTILAASDGSYLEGGQALTGWAFYAPRI